MGDRFRGLGGRTFSGISALLIAVFLGGAAYLGLRVVPAGRAEAAQQWERDLSMLADDRKAALDNWILDRFADGETLAAYPSARALVTRERGDVMTHLKPLLDRYAELHGYVGIFVLLPGEQLAGAGGPEPAPAADCLGLAREALARRATTLDFCLRPSGDPLIAVAAPIRSTSGETASVVGVLLAEADPHLWVYPSLAPRPFSGVSVETVLARREGEDVLFLSPLQHDPAPPFTLRRPLALSDLPAREALEGHERPGGHRDYRGVAVVASARRLDRVPWGLVAKVDEDAALAGFHREIRATATEWLLAFVAFGSVALGLWRAQRSADEASLARSQAQLAVFLDQANEAIFFFDVQGRVRQVNRGAEQFYGWTRQELLGKTIMDLRAPAGRAGLPVDIERIPPEGSRVFETLHQRRDGSVVPVEISTRAIPFEGERGFLSIVRDVSERKRVEDEMRAAEAGLRKLSQAVEFSPASVVITDRAGNIEYVNRKFVEVTGYSAAEALGRNPRILKSGETPPEVYAAMWATIATGREWRGEFHNRKKNGDPFWENASISSIRDPSGTITHFIAVKEDITDRKKAEEALRVSSGQLLQAQKMEAVGRLAGGVAHDFNNLLNVIQGYSELVLKTLPAADPNGPRLEQVVRATQRATSLTRQLLAFSRRQVLEPKVIRLDSVVSETETMLQRLIGEDIRMAVVHGSPVGLVRADPGQMEQVLMNLAVNARDAMPQGGQLTIEIASVILDEAFAACHQPVKPGPYVMLAMSDTGCGMDLETQAHIFEPFFTTKEAGKGTGLGLATVYGIVKQSGGYVWVHSEPGVGTTFKMYLPRVEEPGETLEPDEADKEAAGGAETLLLVEDEASVRDLSRELLESAGYKVLAAASGAEALDLAARHPGGIDLLLTDVIMPGLSGRQVAEQLRKRQPRLRVLFMSGYTDEVIARHGTLEPGLRLLQKPFTTTSLTRAVRAALDAQPG